MHIDPCYRKATDLDMALGNNSGCNLIMSLDDGLATHNGLLLSTLDLI